MDWGNSPIGTMRHDELLNALLAIWQTQYNIIASRRDPSEFAEGYETGFEEGLDAIAQVAGLTEYFETGKALCRARMKEKLSVRIEFIDGRPALLSD